MISEAWRTARRVAGYYPRVLKLLWEANPRYALLSILLTVVSSAVAPAQVWMSKVVIDRVLQALKSSTGATGFDGYALLAPIGLIFLVWLLGGVCQSLTGSIKELLAFQSQNYIDYLVLKKAAQMDIAFYEIPEFFDQMENARQKSWQAHNLAYFCIESLGVVLSLGALLGLLFRLHPLAVVVLLLTSIPHIVVASYYGSRRFRLMTSRAPAQRMVYYLSQLLGSRDAVKEIRLFELHGPFLEKSRHYWQKFFNENKRLMFLRERATLLFRVLSMAGTAGIWAYAVIQAALARITIGDLALVFQVAEQSRDRLSGLFHMGGLFYEHSLFVGNLFNFLDLAPNSVEGALSPVSQDGGRPLLITRPIREGIEFRHVSFRYPRSERFVLRDLSFVLRAGETVAVVGENGAGKTTLVKLLARFYDPTEGTIFLDGRDLREYDLDSLRRHVGIIFQDFVRYNLSARENIGFGRIEFAEDRERVTRAAQDGGAQPVIERLPKGFETMLGRTFEDGVDLSGGEWQKLALSRAFMREAQMLILDEPTASLDALAEQEVYNRFMDLTAGKTTILISHRFSTVRMAEHILVLQDSRLIEEGSHHELMTFDGQYARMFNTQAERYR